MFEKHLIEKWLSFYTFQLKRDLNDEAQSLLNTLELANEQEGGHIKPDMSIIDINAYNRKNQAKSSGSAVPNRELKSKLLLDSIKTLFLLINKVSRLTGAKSFNTSNSLLEKINMKRVKLDVVFNFFIDSILEIINHFLLLNNAQQRVQQEQDQVLDYEPPLNGFVKRTKSNCNNYITLKQSNEIVKQFHSISNILMISISSIKNM